MVFGKNHTKPIPTPKNGILQVTASNSKKRHAKSRFPCGAATFRDKLQQAAASQNRLRVIGNDEVGSSNLPSSSRKILETAMVSRIFSFFCKTAFFAASNKSSNKFSCTPRYIAASSFISSGFSARI